MKASLGDLCRKSTEIIHALYRNERVTVLYRGKPVGILRPIAAQPGRPIIKAADHPAFGLWAGREDMTEVTAHVRDLRKGRFDP